MPDKELPTIGPKIVQMAPVMLPVPTKLGTQIQVITYGLGDDSKLYAWSTQDKKWILA